jgi:hypothetical protein
MSRTDLRIAFREDPHSSSEPLPRMFNYILYITLTQFLKAFENNADVSTFIWTRRSNSGGINRNFWWYKQNIKLSV